MAKGEGSEFDNMFNPKLKLHSNYFSALDKMMACADKHAATEAHQRETVCAKEFKELRLAAFKDELLYHNVNRRFFMNELAGKKLESPY